MSIRRASLLLLPIFATGLPLSPAKAAPHFKAPNIALLLPSANPGSNYYGLFAGLGDIDGDGRVDVIAGATNGLYVFHRNPDGTFGAPDSYLPSTVTNVLAVTNADGVAGNDVIVLEGANPIPPSILVTMRNVGGTLSASANPVSLPGADLSVTVADFNEDGRPDAAAAIPDQSQVYLCLNDGAGGFLAPQVLTTGITAGARVSASDLNADGHIDLLVSDGAAGDSAAALLGDGHAVFASPVLSVITSPGVAAAGPFDNLAGDDLVTFNTSFAYAFIAGAGNGSFGSAQPLTTVQGGAFGAASGHFNTGPDLDCVVLSYDPFPGIRGMLGHGDGTFTAARDAFLANSPIGLAAKDVDGDGFDDVVSASQISFLTELFLSNGDGTFGSPQMRTAAGFNGVALADMDGDGKLDAVQPNRLTGAVSVFKGAGDGTFAAAGSVAGTGAPIAAAAVRLNADARPDVLVPSGSVLEIYLNDGAGNLLAPSTVPVAGSARSLATADVDLDGNVDVAVPARTSAVVTVLLGNGLGGFSAAPDVTVPSGSATSAAIARFDADAIPDLAVASTTQVQVYQGLGGGGFSGSPLVLPASSGVQRLVAADVDGDGRSDLVAGSASTKVYYWRNNGAGGFEARVDIDTQPYTSIGNTTPTAVEPAVSDFDGDGAKDLLVLINGAYTSLIPGTTPGAFGTPIALNAGGTGSSIALGDLDGDGDLDGVITSANGSNWSTLSTLLNQQDLVGVPPVGAPRGTGVAIESAWPNPAQGPFTLDYSVPSPGPVDIELVTIAGRVALRQREIVQASGRQTVRLAGAAQLAPGVYTALIRHAAGTATRKVVVLGD